MALLTPPGYAYVHRDVGRRRHDGGIYPLFFQKGSNRGGGAFHHRFRSRQIFGVAKDFFPNFPNLPEKVFVQLLPTNSLSQRSLFVGVTSKKGLHVFLCKHWEPLFEVKQR